MVYKKKKKKNGGHIVAKSTGKAQPFWRGGSHDDSRESLESGSSAVDSVSQSHYGCYSVAATRLERREAPLF